MNISAVILAAGQSKRMGQPKMLLPWRDTTILGKVIATLQQAGIEDILVVTGGARDEVEKIAVKHNAQVTYNQNYAAREMLESIQLGLRGQKAQSEAALICLGDQPQVEEENVKQICKGFIQDKARIIVPSYQMRRGHPWLIAREFWDEILQLRTPQSMRDFLNTHKDVIFYVECGSPEILQDIDNPADYLKYKP